MERSPPTRRRSPPAVGDTAVRQAASVEAIHRCRGAGIRVIMVTGDHGETAEAIAQRIGLIDGRAAILDGAAIDGLDDRELVSALEKRDALVSRVTPEPATTWVPANTRSGASMPVRPCEAPATCR